MDVTIALQNMVVAAWVQGVGSCWMGAFDEGKLKDTLNLPADSAIVGAVAGTHASPCTAAAETTTIQRSRRVAARRLAWGKFTNAGQTCIAPDYVLCPEDRIADFVAALSEAVNRMFPAITGNPDYTSIVNDRQNQRLRNVLDDARDKGATVVQVNGRGEKISAPQIA